MKKQLHYKSLFALLILMLNLTPTGQAFAIPALLVNSKVLTAGRAIASWPSGIVAGEKRPVLVFLPGWGGSGVVNAAVSTQNTNLVNEGYVTLAIGFDSSAAWVSDIDVKTQGLDKLCADGTIPANCNAVVLVGSSYGGAQNYWVIEHLRSNGYDGGVGSKGKVLGFLSEDAGYGAPVTNASTGAYTRTGLADTASYSVAMIENLGDTTFPVNECTWGNCGARELSNAHLARGDNNVFSICPLGGEHGTRGFANWNAWVVSAIKTIIHVTYGIPAFTGYTTPALTVDNTCIDTTHFAVIGDYGLAGSYELDVANQVKSWNPDFIVTLGDNNYDSGAASTIDANIGQYYHDFISPYTGSYGAPAATNRFFPVLGNHDWGTANAQPYLDYFSLPGNERYYDFIQGPVHFFMLDSDGNEPHGNTDTSVQATWLKNSLSASSSPWNIVLLHHAPFSSAQHGSNVTLQWPYETWGADAVLAGHDHTYERISMGAIPYFVNGLGGRSIYGFGTPVAGSQLRYNADYGAMLVDATNAYINFKFITRGGVVIDSFTKVAGGDTTGVFRPSNGLLYLKNANTSGFADVAINYGTAGDYPVVGDWDGNGTATIGIYRNGIFYLRNSNTLGFADLVFAFGAPGDQPIAGDWDNNGTDTIGVYRGSTVTFELRNSNTAGAPDVSFQLGLPGDIGIAGDWNGDGMDTTGVFRPSNGVIFMKNANTSGFADIAINYGIAGDQPVTGDWDNDGIDTIGVYRNAQFLLRNSNTLGFADLVFALGIPGDMPIAGDWDGLP